MRYSMGRWRLATVGAALIGLHFAAAALAQQQETPADLAARIEVLIKQLDADSFQNREKAQAALVEIG